MTEQKHKNTGVKVLSLQIYEALCFVQYFLSKNMASSFRKGYVKVFIHCFQVCFSICAPHDGGKVMIHLDFLVEV